MERQCITHREFKLILDDIRKETDIISEGTDFKYDQDSKIKKHFYFTKFNLFREYPMFIGKVHEKYGRLIDIRTLWGEDDTVTMYIRGLGKELR